MHTSNAKKSRANNNANKTQDIIRPSTVIRLLLIVARRVFETGQDLDLTFWHFGYTSIGYFV